MDYADFKYIEPICVTLTKLSLVDNYIISRSLPQMYFLGAGTHGHVEFNENSCIYGVSLS